MMQEASSEARKVIAAACSSRVPYRLSSDESTTWSTICWYHSRSRACCRSGPRAIRRSGASVPPGAVATTRIPCGAASIASAVVIALTPPFAAAYGTRFMPRVALDETLTMVPDPASIVAPSNLYAADDGARRYAEQLSIDAGYEPVYVGPLDPGARLLEDSSGLTRALAAQLGPFFYRYARPGQL